jgi:membrane-bound lytic murein transglycosylase D
MKRLGFLAFVLLAALCTPSFALVPPEFAHGESDLFFPEPFELCSLEPATPSITESKPGGAGLSEDACSQGPAIPVQMLAVFLQDAGFCSTRTAESVKEPKMCMLKDLSVTDGQSVRPRPLLASLGLTSYSLNPRAARAVDSQIVMFTEKIRKNFAMWLGRSGRYINLMQEILRQEGVPEEMAFLPLVESGFNPRAYSRRRAAGYWQFIPSTGKRYGLKINCWVDERRDPVKSTRAAAAYLRELYGMFDSWSLAMAAYNAGEARIKRALTRTRSSDYWSLLKTRHIRRETKNYVPKFIAARLIAADPEEYGFTGIEYHEDFVYDEVVLTEPLTLDIIAECAGTTPEEIKELNPELRRWSTPPDVSSYTLRIPLDTRDAFLENLSNMPQDKKFGLWLYTVKKGDTVGRISLRTGVPSGVIMSLNKIGRKALIRVGQKLYLPTKKSLRSN